MNSNHPSYESVKQIIRNMKTHPGKTYIKTLCEYAFDLGDMIYAYNHDNIEGYENCVKADIAFAIGTIYDLNDNVQNDSEVMEQARLLGMSAERECALLGEIERMKKHVLVLESKIEPKPVYEEFVHRKEYPVGGFFKIGNEVFKVVTGESTCENCEFLTESDPCHCRDFACDGVNAVLYDTLED